MKRETVLEFIEKHLEKYRLDEHGDAYFEADIILSQLEDWGMKPPCLPMEILDKDLSFTYDNKNPYIWEEYYIDG